MVSGQKPRKSMPKAAHKTDPNHIFPNEHRRGDFSGEQKKEREKIYINTATRFPKRRRICLEVRAIWHSSRFWE